jgi:peptidoglycan hydrolase-like protein with peptidoglycan-binding domain
MTADLQWPILKTGSSGHDVSALQYLLRCIHDRCHSLAADGQFGPATEEAVKAFQSDMHASADGIVGTMTWNKLTLRDTSVVQRGSQGDCVKAAQTELLKHGLLSSPAQVDGSFGPATHAALQEFQNRVQLNPNGLTTPETWQWLICLTTT